VTSPYPGEQLGLYDGVVQAGNVDWASLDVAVQAPVTVAAGDRFYVYSRSTRGLLPEDELGEVGWVIEVASGSATVTIETGYDTGWNYAEPYGWADAGVTTLGAGRTTVPLPSGDRTYGRLHDEGAPLLRFTVASGEAVLTGVWLQVAPPQGMATWVLSDWVAPPVKAVPAKVSGRRTGYRDPDAARRMSSAIHDYLGDFNNGNDHIVGDLNLDPDWPTTTTEALAVAFGFPFDSGWDAPVYTGNAMSAAANWDMNPGTFNLAYDASNNPTGFQYHAELQGVVFQEVRAVWENRTDVRSIDGLTGIAGRDYRPDRYGRPDVVYAGDSASVGWEPGHILPSGTNGERHTNRTRGTVDDIEHPSPHGEVYRLSGTFGQVVEGAQLPVNPNVAGNGPASWAQSETSGATYVTPAPGTDIVLSAKHDLSNLKEPSTAPWGTAVDRASDWVDKVTTGVAWYWTFLADGRFYSSSPSLLVQPPAYRYWMPVFDQPRRPRFYVTYTEVENDPREVSHVVGIGKPAADKSIFRVPTPLGTLRELRPGEKVSDVSVAYPLKVKLEDGSWTVVAGMTPDA